MANLDVKKIIRSLHPLERKIIPYLDKYNSMNSLKNITKLKDVEIMRALQWLTNKKIIELKEDSKEIVVLGPNGKKYLSEGLPEKRLLEALRKGQLTINQAKAKANLSKEELNIALGVLRKKAAIFITKERDLVIKMMDQGKNILQKGFMEEQFIQKEFPLSVEDLSPEEKFSFEQLRRRKDIIKLELVKTKTFKLTDLGKEVVKENVEASDIIDSLTGNILKTSAWKGKAFRRYDIEANVPKLFAAKKQPYRRFLDEVRQSFLAMGFKEMTGPLVETEFWNMDALFMPQFHSARDIHDAYYIKAPKQAKSLPMDLVRKVAKVHENGAGTGSKGWGYAFDFKKTQQNLLRTHDTAISPRILYSEKLEVPGKYFQMVRCFRPDVVDATHLPDFNQTGGFVIEEGINFSHLKGLLKLFAEKFCESDQIKVKPGYFPFTEPSAELMAKHPDLGWIELAGSGIFRPEVCRPLGVTAPVIAWGVGLERLAMFKLNLKDIRQLFSYDLDFIRNARVI